ncbi:hypothetical protein M3152_02455 [Sporosarcina luteola]|uniref:hypothetical protein n=1 Tax=Sporosarcina luteola TaxID=582850 RepID=UPI00203C3994|nr:hypothetical protein [Sporosarcina luteola]MCM3636567.1 hypothetical protein [Sporosarcina luteola]
MAEMKNVIGVDYGKFLLGKYKIFGFIRVYYLLIVFAAINVSSLLLIFIDNPLFRLTNFIVLIVSLIFAIYYFFSYIIIESPFVKKQIYRKELLGFYFSNNEVTNFEADIQTEICNGSRSTKKLSGNITNYFNVYNSDTSESFKDIFGPRSFIYNYDKALNRRRRRIIDQPPYVYRYSLNGCPDISHEFFQLYRYTEIQDRWVLSILELLDNSVEKDEFDYIRLCNFTRVVAQINVYGFTPQLFTYKFLEHLYIYYRKALLMAKVNLSNSTLKKVKALANYTNEQYFQLMISTYKERKEPLYLAAINRTVKSILDCEENGILRRDDHVVTLRNVVGSIEDEQLQLLFAEILGHYYELKGYKQIPEELQLENLQNYFSGDRNRSNSTDVDATRRFLFGEKDLEYL